tara:strand:- start:369339 stop:370163 length:825 start_codon:yes stop_codon:yes gene_type:complete
MKHPIYKSPPIKTLVSNGNFYPVFSETDDYINNYDQISADHLAVFEKDGINPFMEENFWHESEEITANLVRKVTLHGDRLLDVGCGMGRLLAKLPDYERYGMDISSAYLNYASKVGAEICLSKVEDMPYQDNFFNAVVCTDVLEHVLDINAAVTQLFRVVKPAGHLIIRVPFRENLEPYLSPEYPYQMAHLRNFDEHSLRLLFEKIFNGKVIDDIRGPYLEYLAYFKWPIKVRGLNFLVKNGLRVCAWISPNFKQRIVKNIFQPVEITVVIKKL